ncbi:MAG: hypothetical protein E6R03_07965 [Hyphomicrobiaceae bacterium]|nr:MAG: hypothetical protein E6R03_07965 [Hyphomicrobiaceae bacterium]
MRGNFLRAGALAVALIPGAAYGQSQTQPVVINGGGGASPITTCPVGSGAAIACSMPVTVSGSTGTSDVNLVEVDGETVDVGTGAAGLGTQRVTTSTDSTIGTVTTVTNPVGVKGDDGSTIASSSNPLPVVSAPSTASGSGVAPVFSSAVETGHVIKASAGNLYSISVTADATLSAAAWAIMVFNATSVPAAGAVTPAWCVLLPSGATGYTGAFPTPMYLSTGISVAVSVGQTCFTKTDSAHAFISANAK